MEKIKLLKWVQKGMPVEVKGKTMYLHAAGTLDPSGQYCLVCDKNAYADGFDNSMVTVTPVEVNDVKPLL